jgi:glycosyltransferase involved in cell wall biosynthesis
MIHAPHGERVINTRKTTARPKLSVLIPFHRHDPSPMLARLGAASGEDVELVLLDDGSGSAELLARVLAAAARLTIPARVIVWGANRGRAAARNRLIEAALGEYVLFLDADMIPDAPEFLAIWLDVIARDAPGIAFGGLSVRHAPHEPDTALHRFFFQRSDCRDAPARARDPAHAAAASNLLVRRDVLAAVPFDDGFSGWGWEDVDWALRAARVAAITHIDNPATHAGLDSVDTLLRKFNEGGPNYGRLARKHPGAVQSMASHRAARVLKRAPARDRLRDVLAWVARDPFGAAPMLLRHAALKLYRTSLYAEHLP